MVNKTIWDSEIKVEDWGDYIDELKAENSNISVQDIYDDISTLNNDYLQDVRQEFDIQLKTDIIIIADLGLWNGRFSGYKIIKSGNISECFYSDLDYVKWYVDDKGDLRMNGIHHDGNNNYLYRAFKENATEEQKSRLMDKIYNNTVTRTDILRITNRLGDKIGKIYGWKFRGKKPKI